MQRKASEFSSKSSGSKVNANKRFIKKYLDKVKKARGNQKFREVFKVYRMDTEEGRRLYLAEVNEVSYTSPSYGGPGGKVNESGGGIDVQMDEEEEEGSIKLQMARNHGESSLEPSGSKVPFNQEENLWNIE